MLGSLTFCDFLLGKFLFSSRFFFFFFFLTFSSPFVFSLERFNYLGTLRYAQMECSPARWSSTEFVVFYTCQSFPSPQSHVWEDLGWYPWAG